MRNGCADPAVVLQAELASARSIKAQLARFRGDMEKDASAQRDALLKVRGRACVGDREWAHQLCAPGRPPSPLHTRAPSAGAGFGDWAHGRLH